MPSILINKKDFLWAYFGSFFRLSTNVILLPIILHFLSDTDLGIWYVFASISQLVVLLDFGFAPSLSRNIAYVWSGASQLKEQSVGTDISDKRDSRYFKTVLTACQIIYFCIAILALLLLLTVGTAYIFNLDSSNNVIIAWVVYVAGVFLNTLYTYYTSFLRGIGAIAENNKAGIISKSVQIVLSVGLILCGYGLLGLAVSYCVSGVVLRVMSRYYFYHYENIKEMLAEVKIDNQFQETSNLFKIIWPNASRDGLVTLSNYISTQANVLICSSVLGLTTTGSYGLLVQLSSIIASISGIPFSTYLPKMQEMALKKDNENGSAILSKSIILYIVFFILLSIVLVLSTPIIKWLRPNIDINIWMFAAILTQMLLYQISQLFASYISTFNIIPYSKAFVLSSFGSLLISYILAKYTSLGLWSLIISPVFVTLLYNFWKWPLYASRLNKTSFDVFVRKGTLECWKMIIHRGSKY